MGKIHLLTYGDERYQRSMARLSHEAKGCGWFDRILPLSPASLDPSVQVRYREILEEPVGAGYWIWKVILLDDALRRLSDGDVLVYLDAGFVINAKAGARFGQYLDLVESDDRAWLSFQLTHPEDAYTNEAVFEHFGVLPDDPLRRTGQLAGGAHVIRCGAHAVETIGLARAALTADPNLFTDVYNPYDPYSRLVAHRHDQSVLSVARKQMGTIVIPDETFAADWNALSDKPFLAMRRVDRR